MTNPLVSVLIPSYNYARYIELAINSVLAQDMPDFEIVVLDDGSSDGSVELLRQLQFKDSRIRFRAHPANIGMVENWNACLADARGEYVKYLLADDVLYKPTALSEFIALFKADPQVTLAASARAILDENAEVQRVKGFARYDCVVQGDEAISRCVGTGSNLIGEPSAVMFRARDAKRGFDGSYKQLVDLELSFHLLEKGSLAYTSSCLCGFRRHSAQQSSVNRGTSIGQDELRRLVSTYAPVSRRLEDGRLLAGWSYRIDRLGRGGDSDVELERAAKEVDDSIRAKLGSRRALFELSYRLTRPFINLERQFRRMR